MGTENYLAGWSGARGRAERAGLEGGGKEKEEEGKGGEEDP